MRIDVYNQWKSCSMGHGGCFPITVFELYADIHPTYRFLDLTILNFCFVIQFRREPDTSRVNFCVGSPNCKGSDLTRYEDK